MGAPMRLTFLLRSAASVLVLLGLADFCRAQPTISLEAPRAGWRSGATPLSSVIQAQASYVYAQGTFLVNAATAREINARAVEQEIKNAVAYVDAYFKRRELNREWRAKENPDHWERTKKLMERHEEMLRYRYQELMKGDVTGELNWMLRELSGPTLAEEFLYSGAPLADSRLDEKLLTREIDKIWLTDGGSKGSQLLLRAGEGSVLESRWPPALRNPECDLARADFEKARDEVLAALRTGKAPVSHEQQKELMAALNELFESLEVAYPKGSDRRKDPMEFGMYSAGKRFVQSLLAQVHRLVNSDDTTLFERSLAFKGDSVVDLLRHMYHNGLMFASPKPGGEETYRKMFKTMRELYLNLISEPSTESSERPQKPEKKE